MTSEIANTTAKIISALYGNGAPDKASLASLREAETIDSRRAHDVWPILFSEMDERYLSKDVGKPTSAENAIYTSLRCYSIYQQGIDHNVYASKGTEGLALFVALAKLRNNEEIRNALDRRVQNLFSNRNILSVIKSVTQLVRILKSNDRNLLIDYADLAQDLYYFQNSFESSKRVFLKWGQQYYSRQSEKEADKVEE